MATAYSLRCPACGSDFLATHTRPATITSCPHCAHNAPLRDFLSAGAAPLGPAPALPVRRREIVFRPPEPVAAPSAPAPLPDLLQTPPPAPAPSAALRRPVSTPQFLPAKDFSSAAPPPPPPAKRGASGPRLVLLACLPLLAILAAGMLLWPPAAELPQSTSAAGQRREEVRMAEPSPPDAAPALPTPGTPLLTPRSEAALANQIAAARLSDEAPALLRSLFDGPPAERPARVLDGGRHAAALERFFSRPGLALTGVRLLQIRPVDLVTGRQVVLFQAITTANSKGALARFHGDGGDAPRLDWPLFEETHDALLAGFLQENGDDPRWFHAGLRRSHGLDLPAAFREAHHIFELQMAPGDPLGVPGVVARDLPLGRFLDGRGEWRVSYLARLLLMRKTLPEGAQVLEILDCEGAGLRRSTQSTASKTGESVPVSPLPAP